VHHPNGRVVPALPVTPGSTLAVVANPMSGRDIRRLVAQASVFPNAEKTNMVVRLLGAAGAVGVERALVSTDAMGVAAGVLRARQKIGAHRWPEPEFVEAPITGTADDTREQVRLMRERGASVIVLLGGDGTVRAATATSDDVPLLPLSTGTNNAFPEMWEATVAGTAAGLLATGQVDAASTTYRAKALHVTAGDAHEIALVDVCVSTVPHVGSKALWQPSTLRELYCAFAEPHAVGLSSVAGQLRPTPRTAPSGVVVRLAEPAVATRTVFAPIAPGVVAAIGVRETSELVTGVPQVVALERGTLAVDGEREIELGPTTAVTVTLAHDGPRVLDVRAVMAAAARQQLLVTQAQEITGGNVS
jgi:predicted polyphosphate/ATP-dependent NAD kinase